MGDDHTRTKALWRKQIALDRRLSAVAVRAGILLIDDYFSREKGFAYPSHARLAGELEVSRRGLQKDDHWGTNQDG